MFPFLRLGPILLQLPGLALLAGVWVGSSLADKEAARLKLKRATVSNLIFYALVAGIVGARLGYAVRYLSTYLANPFDLLRLTPATLSPQVGLAGRLPGRASYWIGGPGRLLASDASVEPTWPTRATNRSGKPEGGSPLNTPSRSSPRRMPRIGRYPVRGGLLLVILLAGVVLAGRLAQGSPSASGVPVVINQTAVPPVPTLNPEWVTQGATAYAQECGTCHGANLEGAANWKQSLPDGSLPPPPHDASGHTWHHSDSLLLAIIAEGGDPLYNSKMPGFRDKLTEEERRAVLEFIKSKWGKNELEFQWWMTATESGP